MLVGWDNALPLVNQILCQSQHVLFDVQDRDQMVIAL